MTLRYLCLLILLLVSCETMFAQNDSIITIREVEISDMQLKDFSNTQSVLIITDSIIKKNQPSLTSLLNYNSGIYFKENGFGMVSSPSFRGTTAQQTAVIWNGINVNSQFNGQSDFNSINGAEFNSVAVRAGGGSTIYGSSAIGGSIHLNNELELNDGFYNEFLVRYGSFNTTNAFYKVTQSYDKYVLHVGVTYSNSDNDYEFPESKRRNVNGEYHNAGLNSAVLYRLNSTNSLKLYSRLYQGERHFSLVNPTDTKTKYRDYNSWNLLEWTGLYGRFVSNTKFAFLSEEYNYFGNIDNDYTNYGTANTIIGKYDLKFSPNAKIKLNAILEYSQTEASGSDIEKSKLKIASAAVLIKHQLFQSVLYEVGFRKETANDYESPILFSAGLKLDVAKNYSININGSRNFRIPTFNDLYWSDGSNFGLQPETSSQVEIGNHIKFQNIKLSFTGYYIKIKDMIQWIPGITEMWSPQNINKANVYGAEAMVKMHKKFGRHDVDISGTYNYTVSKNELTGYQLIYVPYHKLTAGAGYGFKKFNINYQFLFNGYVFIRSDNNPRYNIPGYAVSNLSLDYDFGKKHICKAGVQINNLLDESYMTMVGRPFPGRNFNFYLDIYI